MLKSETDGYVDLTLKDVLICARFQYKKLKDLDLMFCLKEGKCLLIKECRTLPLGTELIVYMN